MRSELPRVLPNRYRRLIRTLTEIENGVLVLLLSTMIVLAVGQVVMRNLLDFGFPWTDPMTRLLVLWVGLMGAMVASRNNKHINMDIVSRWLPESMLRVTRIATQLFTAVVCAVVAYNAARFVYLDYMDGLVAFGLFPAWIAEAIVPFAFGVMSLRYLLYCFLPPDAAAAD
jgi:TRAP-type C4-dicarboxylate transport system permease small subunit